MKIFKKIIGLLGRKIALVRDCKKSFNYYLTICAIFRDEAIYLEEWLTFHYRMGVSHFYLYNDRSQDHYMEVLDPWIRKGVVTLKDWNMKGQIPAYNDCIKNNRMSARWIAFIDLDEFLFSPLKKDLPTILKQYEDFSAIFVYWVLFGSSGHVKRPSGSVLENYTKCLDYQSAVNECLFPYVRKLKKFGDNLSGRPNDGKSIVNPRLVKKYIVHKPESFWYGFLIDESKKRFRLNEVRNVSKFTYSTLRINHYWSKSIECIINKVNKGSVYNYHSPKRDLDTWLDRESRLNVAEDMTIQYVYDSFQSSRIDKK